MRAIEISRPGGPDVLRVAERPMPVPADGEVLIEVKAAGISRADAMQRQGKYPPPPGSSDIPGLEVAGVIAGARRARVRAAHRRRIRAVRRGAARTSAPDTGELEFRRGGDAARKYVHRVRQSFYARRLK